MTTRVHSPVSIDIYRRLVEAWHADSTLGPRLKVSALWVLADSQGLLTDLVPSSIEGNTRRLRAFGFWLRNWATIQSSMRHGCRWYDRPAIPVQVAHLNSDPEASATPTALDHLVNAWASDLSPDVTSQQLYDLAVRYGLLPHLCRGISNEGAHADKVKWGVWLKAQPLATRILSGRKLYRCPKPSAPDVLAVRLLRPDVRDAIASMAAQQNVTRERVISSVLAEYWGLDLD